MKLKKLVSLALAGAMVFSLTACGGGETAATTAAAKEDAKATTDAAGKATINGYFGDYDVTVTANGTTYTDMVAFYKGYENVLEITLD